ncbi:hypothetical protein FAZ95_03170 [Trinickia violacea]|uniref:Uncharacterized protein n=1 Tax=Trinickia violacea TaxID=2571746 RepID=A0A4P8IKN7_9BURK|nr:hypothetical protein [Trinickia violacea]QCP48277.1 hypothetical protein FAZ95_03170 [Trinickia violacea]
MLDVKPLKEYLVFYSPPLTGLEVTVKKFLCLLVVACATLAISAPASYGCDEGSYNNQSGTGK